MRMFGYARAATGGQTLDSQLQVLQAAGCEQVFREEVGGAKADRVQLTRLLAMIGRGDMLVVSRLDRLARSTRDLLDILDALVLSGAAFRSLGDPWADTTGPQGRLLVTVLGGLAGLDRELIRARTGEGRARATARGQPMGRPPALTPHQRREVATALSTGRATQADLARRFNVSHSTISRLADKLAPAALAPLLDADTERAARAFMLRLEGRYAVRQGILFGSRARRTHTADSDADIAVVLDGVTGDRTAAALDMAGIAFDVFLETGVLVEALPLWQGELERPERFGNPGLIQNIRREGVRL